MLMVDTCGSTGGVAVARWRLAGGEPLQQAIEILAERALPGRETQERLMTALDEVLQQAGLGTGDLDVLAVVTGPGSFTGVRIGIAAVKGLAEALRLPVVALSRLAVLAAQAQVAGHAQETEAWVDAGRQDVFVGRYVDGACVEESMAREADAVAALQARAASRVVLMEDRLAALVPSAVRVPPVGVREALPLAVARASTQKFADVALLDANYLRIPDAELARRAAEAAATAGSR